MATMTHEARTAKIVETLRSASLGEWTEVKVACVGSMFVHRVPVEAANKYGWNECWVRFGSANFADSTSEDRGTAEAIAKKLCLKLRAPSKVVGQAIETIKANLNKTNPFGDQGIDGLRAPEVAAMLNLDEEITYQALDCMVEMGLVVDKGDYGFTRSSNG